MNYHQQGDEVGKVMQFLPVFPHRAAYFSRGGDCQSSQKQKGGHTHGYVGALKYFVYEQLQIELDFEGQKIKQVTNGIGKRIETNNTAKVD
jgi:hypothetical protein